MYLTDVIISLLRLSFSDLLTTTRIIQNSFAGYPNVMPFCNGILEVIYECIMNSILPVYKRVIKLKFNNTQKSSKSKRDW